MRHQLHIAVPHGECVGRVVIVGGVVARRGGRTEQRHHVCVDGEGALPGEQVVVWARALRTRVTLDLDLGVRPLEQLPVTRNDDGELLLRLVGEFRFVEPVARDALDPHGKRERGLWRRGRGFRLRLGEPEASEKCASLYPEDLPADSEDREDRRLHADGAGERQGPPVACARGDALRGQEGPGLQLISEEEPRADLGSGPGCPCGPLDRCLPDEEQRGEKVLRTPVEPALNVVGRADGSYLDREVSLRAEAKADSAERADEVSPQP